MDTRFEELKKEIFMKGLDSVEEFLGFEISNDWDSCTIENAMNDVYEKMPEEDLEEFYKRFCI